MVKVTSHLSAEDVEDGIIHPLAYLGNFLADALAEKAAETCQVDESQYNLVHWIDRQAARVRHRLAVTMQDAAKVTGNRKPNPKEPGPSKPNSNTIAAAIEASEHSIVSQGSIYACAVCFQNVSKSCRGSLIKNCSKLLVRPQKGWASER